MIDSNTILQLSQEGKASELRDVLRHKAYTSLYFFTKVILSYRELQAHLHLPLCDGIQNTARTVRKRGRLWPRGHFKSTCGAKAYALWRVLPKLTQDPWGQPYDEDLLFCHDQNCRVLIIGESEEVASKDLKDLKWAIEHNQILKWLFPEIIPPNFNATVWRDDEVLLPRSKSFDESTFTAKGVGGKGTGFHYDLLVYDDIIGEDASHSEAKMKDAIDWFRTAPGLLNDPERGEELILGTRWKDADNDLYGWIMQNIPTQYQWDIKGCYADDGEPIFPERFSKPTLELIRQRQGEYL